MDLDPSAIAASLGSGSGSANLADAYEAVDDSADFLGKTVSSALRLSGDGLESGKKKNEKKSKKKEKSFSGKSDERSSSGSLADRPDALFASAEKKEKKKKKKKKKGGSDEGEKPKKPSKKVRDWDESESD